MSMSNAAEQAFLDLLFLNTDWAGIGDAAGLQNSATAGSFYVALHTADPGEAGSQTTNEIAYTSYARVPVARSGVGWSRSGSTMSNAALVQFPQCTGGSGTATHFSIGTESSGAGQILAAGRNIEGAASITLALADADLQLIVSASGVATFTLSGDATLAGALYASGTADLSISVSTVTLGAIINALGTASLSLTADGAATALGHMSGTTEVVDALSPTALASAVWERVIEAGYTAEQVLRIVAAHAAGAATGLESGNPQFVGLDGSTVRIDGAYSAGTRTIDALNGG